MNSKIVQVTTASALALSSVIANVSSAGAVALIGNLSFTGDLFFSKNAFDFVSSPFVPGGTGTEDPNIDGDILVSTISNNIGQPGTFGTMKDICNPNIPPSFAPCDVVTETRPVVGGPLDDFITFQQNVATFGPGLASFMLTQVSTPSFQQGATQTTVQFDAIGMFFSADGMASNGTGRITAQINNTVFAGFPSLPAFLAAQGTDDFFEASDSAVFEATIKPVVPPVIPEGSSMVGLGVLGLFGFGQIMRKNRLAQKSK